MRLLAALLVLLATPLSAQAENHWHGGRGGPAYGYGPPGRGPYGQHPHGPYGGPPGRAYPPPYMVGQPPAGFGAPPPYLSQQQRAREDVRSGRRVPLPYVIEKLRHERHAEYVDTRESVDGQGRPTYVLRFRRNGRYMDVHVDAMTGAVEPGEEDRGP